MTNRRPARVSLLAGAYSYVHGTLSLSISIPVVWHN